MRFEGGLLYHGLYTISALLNSSSPTLEEQNRKVSVRLVVDTGCSKTIISKFDAERLGVDLSKLALSKDSMLGVVGAPVYPLILDKCTLSFLDIETDKWYTEHFESVFVHDTHTNLLGIDMLKNYIISFTTMSVYLDPNIRIT